MQANEVIKNLMAQKEITQTEMREKMEMKSQSGVSQALNRDMKISMLIRFLKDCSLTVRTIQLVRHLRFQNKFNW